MHGGDTVPSPPTAPLSDDRAPDDRAPDDGAPDGGAADGGAADGGAARAAPDIGHYFDQTVFDLQYVLLMARARRLALEAELAAQGIEIDPQSGAVRLDPA